MTPDRLTELRDKVLHGYNLLASEAREVFAHYGEPIEEGRNRCLSCNGVGSVADRRTTLLHQRYKGTFIGTCLNCNGTGYEVTR